MTILSIKDSTTLFQAAYHDPVFFIEEILGDPLWSVQKEICYSVRDNKRTAVPACHSAGKSYVSARILLWFLCTREDSIVITTAPTARNIQKVLWSEVHRAWHNAKIPLGGELLSTVYKIKPGWFAIGFPATRPNSASGYHATSGHMLVIMDEACDCKQETYDSLKTVLTTPQSRFLAIGNPTSAQGRFFKECYDEKVGANVIPISAFDTPNFNLLPGEDTIHGLASPEWEEGVRNEYGIESNYYRVRVLGQFPLSDDDGLIPPGYIRNCMAMPQSSVQKDGRVRFGVDPAHFGGDETVIAISEGNIVYELIAFKGLDTVAVTKKVEDLYDTFKPYEIRIDSVALGQGIADNLRNKGYPLVEVNVGRSALNKTKFQNMRAEKYWELREKIMNTQLKLPEDDVLLKQLSSIRYKTPTQNTKILIESKKDMKDRGMDSPDRADAVLLATADNFITSAIETGQFW